jgi:multidrug resistance efflux pump
MSLPDRRLLILVAALATVPLAACNKASAAKTRVTPAASPATPYAAVANGKVDVEGGIISVAARRAGIVRDVLAQEGDEVTKGQILARQEDDQPRLAAAYARSQVVQARAQIASTQLQFEAAKRELARMEDPAAAKFFPAQKIDQARDTVRQTQAALDALAATVDVAEAASKEADYDLELTNIRAPVDGRIIRRYANPGSGASTLNVSNMFDLEPKAARIVRAEVPEAALSQVAVGQSVQIISEFDASKSYTGKVLRRAGLFGARKLQSDDPSERTDDRVVEVVVSANDAPLLIGQRVLVKFIKPGKTAA